MKPRIIEGPFYFKRHATTAQLKAELPELHRSVTFERAKIDEEKRVIPVVFATETPVDRWFGRERLICTPEACNATRANNKGAFLSEHDRTKQIGVIVPNSVRFDGPTALAQLRFAKKGALAQEEWDNVLDDVRGNFSVGYVVHRLVLREEDDEKGDLYDAMSWEVLEISLVSIPADQNCTIDESRESEDKHPVVIQAETEQTALAISTMKRNARNYFARHFMAPDTGGNPQIPTTPKDDGEQKRQHEADQKKAIEDARKAETERIREINALGARYGIQDKALEFVTEGRSIADLKEYILENDIRKVAEKSGDPGNGKSPLLTGGPQNPVVRTIGDYLVESEELKQYLKAEGKSKRSASFEIIGFDTRATLASTAIPAGSISTTELPMVPALETRLTVVDLMRQGTVSTGQVHYMLETAPTNAAAMTAEGGLKPEATFEFTDATSIVRKVAVIARVNDEALEDYAFLRSYLDGKLLYMIREREEAQVLAGDGNAPNLRGILNTSGIQTQAKGSDSNIDAIHKAITKIRVNAQAEPSGVVLHPNDAQLLFLAKDANGQYFAGGPFLGSYGNGPFTMTRRIWGLPIVETTMITEGTALVGAFRQYSAIYRRSGITVETTNSDGDDFKYNRTAIRVEERIAVVVERPAAFCTVTGIAA